MTDPVDMVEAGCKRISGIEAPATFERNGRTDAPAARAGFTTASTSATSFNVHWPAPAHHGRFKGIRDDAMGSNGR